MDMLRIPLHGFYYVNGSRQSNSIHKLPPNWAFNILEVIAYHVLFGYLLHPSKHVT